MQRTSPNFFANGDDGSTREDGLALEGVTMTTRQASDLHHQVMKHINHTTTDWIHSCKRDDQLLPDEAKIDLKSGEEILS